MARGRWALAAAGVAATLVAGLGPAAWEAAYGRGGDPVASYDDERVQRHPGEATLTYVERANRVVADAVVHDENPNRDQTWAVAVMDSLPGDHRTDFGMLHPAGLRAGLCSQHAVLLAEILRRNGVDTADAYQIDGHVVTEFEAAGEQYVVDPDLGIAPFSVDWSDPDQLASAATVAYEDAPAPYDVAWAVPIYTDTSDDAGVYSQAKMTAIAQRQGAWLVLIEWGRWIVLALGVTAVTIGVRGALRSRSE